MWPPARTPRHRLLSSLLVPILQHVTFKTRKETLPYTLYVTVHVCYLKRTSFHEGSPRQPPNHEAIAALLSYSFHAAILKDDVNMIPLDHAIRSNASPSTVKLLRSAMQRGNQLNEGIQSFITATKNMHVIKHDEFMSSLSINSRPTEKVRRTPLVHTLHTQAARSA